MKVLLVVVICVFLSGCTQNKTVSVDDGFGGRIKFKEHRTIKGQIFLIIEVDSVEYLTQYQGGFIRLPKTNYLR